MDLSVHDKILIVVPMQSVSVTISVVSSNPTHFDAYWIQHYVMLVSYFQQVVFFPPVSSTNKTDDQEMAKMLS